LKPAERSHITIPNRLEIDQVGKRCLVPRRFISVFNNTVEPTFGVPWILFQIAYWSFGVFGDHATIRKALSGEGIYPRDQPRFVLLACENHGYGESHSPSNRRRFARE